MQIELLPAEIEQLPLIRNLYQFYAYESSDWEQEDVELDGRFYVNDEHLLRYWQEPNWSAQLILIDGFIAGFLLLECCDETGRQIMEFADLFILRKYRRLGIGRALAVQTLGDGRAWLLNVYRQDTVALAFCHQVMADLGHSGAPRQACDDSDLLSYRIMPARH
ncbi:Predicted acetyltransferase [Pseudomonas cuatrocienegasensis]|uniref:Predicted acetyltransferase n=1 Tax=Pseudomonas cuatrocienegasensis TaxID=543360 RepID=A0ABY1BEN8_9PSED|nr:MULTISPECIES: GNAT family N-acetyltransferase [Pseudomonas]OEC34031.1 acetyltransferase [Pseudomonas sp. 21C1]SEQ67464.1 Predicted acetyltransferase [Pseudomonas cuatrocienegasensis]